MPRPKKTAEHQSHERWIVSYADFVTLLFAFFVVMFATANANKEKAHMVSESIRSALNQKTPDPPPGTRGSSSASYEMTLKQQQEKLAEMARSFKQLQPSQELLKRELKDEIARGEVEVHLGSRGLTISFKQAAFFDSGSDALKETALPTIAKVGRILLKLPNSIRLEGHTDNMPISTGRFTSNWALSSSRAIAVLDVFSRKFSVPQYRLAVGGYADVAPVASNDTEEGRAKNRRVDVVILSELGSATEPGQAPKKS